MIEAHHLKTAHIMSDTNKTSCKMEDNEGRVLDLSPHFFILQHTKDFNDLKQHRRYHGPVAPLTIYQAEISL